MVFCLIHACLSNPSESCFLSNCTALSWKTTECSHCDVFYVTMCKLGSSRGVCTTLRESSLPLAELQTPSPFSKLKAAPVLAAETTFSIVGILLSKMSLWKHLFGSVDYRTLFYIPKEQQLDQFQQQRRVMVALIIHAFIIYACFYHICLSQTLEAVK